LKKLYIQFSKFVPFFYTPAQSSNNHLYVIAH